MGPRWILRRATTEKGGKKEDIIKKEKRERIKDCRQKVTETKEIKRI